MQDTNSQSQPTLEHQITERYGPLLSQTQLAELLGRSTGGLRYSLSYPLRPPNTRAQGMRSQDRPPGLLPRQ